jgi:hypothetical protein
MNIGSALERIDLKLLSPALAGYAVLGCGRGASLSFIAR